MADEQGMMRRMIVDSSNVMRAAGSNDAVA